MALRRLQHFDGTWATGAEAKDHKLCRCRALSFFRAPGYLARLCARATLALHGVGGHGLGVARPRPTHIDPLHIGRLAACCGFGAPWPRTGTSDDWSHGSCDARACVQMWVCKRPRAQGHEHRFGLRHREVRAARSAASASPTCSHVVGSMIDRSGTGLLLASSGRCLACADPPPPSAMRCAQRPSTTVVGGCRPHGRPSGPCVGTIVARRLELRARASPAW